MSDYRYQIVDHNGIRSLHVMIDAEPIAECHIPLDHIQEATGKSYAQMIIESAAKLFEISPLTGDVIRSVEDKE